MTLTAPIFAGLLIAAGALLMLYAFWEALGRLWHSLAALRRRKVLAPPQHPAARVIRARRLDLTEEDARNRWQQITEQQLGEYLPKPRDGGQR